MARRMVIPSTEMQRATVGFMQLFASGHRRCRDAISRPVRS